MTNKYIDEIKNLKAQLRCIRQRRKKYNATIPASTDGMNYICFNSWCDHCIDRLKIEIMKASVRSDVVEREIAYQEQFERFKKHNETLKSYIAFSPEEPECKTT